MSRWIHGAAALLALSCSLGAAAALPGEWPGGYATVADSARARPAYARGFADAINGRGDRERNRDYDAGYRSGRAKRQDNADRPNGRDYSRGYVEGFNRYRERIAIDSRNRAYAAGYRAGQADHTQLVAGAFEPPVAGSGAAPTSVENLVGRRASGLDADMKFLGFERTGQFKGNKELLSTWQSRARNACVRVIVRDGRVATVNSHDVDRCW